MPDFESKPYMEVKLTAAAVKREALAIKKAEQEEEKRLKDLELHQRDDTEFNTWRREMDERDEVLRIDYIQRKKIEMELAREKAIIAQEEQKIENKKNAKKMKTEAIEREHVREANILEAKEKRAGIVSQVKDQRHITGEAVQAMKDENRELRNQIAKEIKDGLKRKADEEAAEMAKK